MSRTTRALACATALAWSASACSTTTIPPLQLGVIAEVASCGDVTLPQTKGHPGPWTVSGHRVFGVFTGADGQVRFRAPAVARETTLTLRSAGDGSVLQVKVSASPAADEIGLAPGCAPFPYGVASGDPDATSVWLWTATEEATKLTWEVSRTPQFEVILAAGATQTTSSSAFTTQVRAGGLATDSTYYYRFVRHDGVTSEVGRTRTAGSPTAGVARIALISCSSLFSGYFNGYADIAARDDINLLIHLGDYIYDYVDKDEQVRVPTPPPQEPSDLQSHRERHQLYLSDPDLRAARASHPWMVIWDNHDLEAGSPPHYEGGLQAFREWVPMTPSPVEDRAYRSISFGALAEVWLVDALLHKNKDLHEDTGAPDMLGAAQWSWLKDGLKNSQAAWKLIGSQKLMSPFQAPIALGGSTWKAYPETRARLLNWLQKETNGDSLILSGDAHLTVYANLSLDQPVAVEMLGGSLTRGNVDETVEGDADVFKALSEAFRNLNPHFAGVNLIDHGYGELEVTADRIRARMRFFPILEPTEQTWSGPWMTVQAGERQWRP